MCVCVCVCVLYAYTCGNQWTTCRGWFSCSIMLVWFRIWVLIIRLCGKCPHSLSPLARFFACPSCYRKTMRDGGARLEMPCEIATFLWLLTNFCKCVSPSSLRFLEPKTQHLFSTLFSFYIQFEEIVVYFLPWNLWNKTCSIFLLPWCPLGTAQKSRAAISRRKPQWLSQLLLQGALPPHVHSNGTQPG